VIETLKEIKMPKVLDKDLSGSIRIDVVTNVETRTPPAGVKRLSLSPLGKIMNKIGL